MTQRVRDFFFILPTDEFRLLKECLPRHSIGFDALDLALPVANGKRAFTCSEKQLQDVIHSVGLKFPLGKALAILIQQQCQPISKSQNQAKETEESANLISAVGSWVAVALGR